jgi:aryl-alcohol dehydrogenase-like predicted oxidoreductase
VRRISRRRFLTLSAAGAALAAAGPARAAVCGPRPMRTRTIPRTGEELPVIGLGTWQTFDVGPEEADRAPLREVLSRFFAAGGRVIDSSPMYGRAEEVVGDLVADLAPIPGPFLATKVWTRGQAAGEAQMATSLRRLRQTQLDLMQVHNLLDVRAHLPTLRAWKEQGRVRHVGITHFATSAFDELEQLLATERLDFVQLPYSVASREAEARLLPAAAANGAAVLVMRPFEEGELFRAVKGRPLPAWAAEIDCTRWSQVFLKFILSHPAVTAVLPATADPDHLAENVRAGTGRLPDAPLRRRIVAELGL